LEIKYLRQSRSEREKYVHHNGTTKTTKDKAKNPMYLRRARRVVVVLFFLIS